MIHMNERTFIGRCGHIEFANEEFVLKLGEKICSREYIIQAGEYPTFTISVNSGFSWRKSRSILSVY